MNLAWPILAGALGALVAWWLTRRSGRNESGSRVGSDTQTALDTIATPVMSIDRDFKIVRINKTAASLGGKRPEDLVGTKCYDLFRTEHCRTEKCALHRAMRDGKPVAERTVARPGDMTIPILYSGAPIFGANGDVVGATEFVQEISAIVEAQKATRTSVDSMGSAVGNLNQVMGRQSERVGELSRTSSGVASAAQQMEGNFSSVSAAVEQTNGIFQSIAGAVEEMNASIGEIARGTTRASETVGSAVGRAQQLEDRVRELNGASEEISSIVNTIIRISEQTKLLALNATIEAARAGSAGKGFAVVAGEVKELARQTADAIVDIQNKVGNITGTTAKTTGDIREISSVIGQINETVTTIAAAIEEQSATTAEISSNISEAVQGMQEVTRNVGQASMATSSIASQTVELNDSLQEVSQDNLRLDETSQELSRISKQLEHAAEALA